MGNDASLRSLKELQDKIKESNRLLQALHQRVEDLEGQIQTNRNTVEVSKDFNRKKLSAGQRKN